MNESQSPPFLRLAGVSSPPSASAELPRPLHCTPEMVELIEGWAANAANHGVLGAWEVLMATSLWRTQ